MYNFLFQVIELDMVFVVGVYCGPKKPSSASDYLEDLICELQTLVSPIEIKHKNITVILEAILADAPARCFLKGTKNFNGYYGCDRCSQEGRHDGRRIIFPETDAEPRTNENFRLRRNHEHHKYDSPFERLESFDMIKGFPIDPMHCVFEGIVPKLLSSLSALRIPLRVTHSQSLGISRLMLSISVPHDFERKPKPLEVLGMWKASQFRVFILYLAPFVTRDLHPVVHKCFLSLHIIVRLLCHPQLCATYMEYCKSLITSFLAQCTALFGAGFLVYNFHALLHILDDVNRFGPLDNFSCFWGEIFLRFLKKCCNTSTYELNQIVKRVFELGVHLGQLPTTCTYPICKISFPSSVHLTNVPGLYFKKVILKSTFLSSAPDCYFMSISRFFYRMKCVVKQGDTISLICNQFTNVASAYEDPVDSKNLFDIVQVGKLRTLDECVRT